MICHESAGMKKKEGGGPGPHPCIVILVNFYFDFLWFDIFLFQQNDLKNAVREVSSHF